MLHAPSLPTATLLLSLLPIGCSSGEQSRIPDQEAPEPEVSRISVPQHDLDVRVDGFRISPPMGMGSWAAFASTGSGDEAVVMGDIVVLEDELAPVQSVLVERGLTVTALHNHFARADPAVLYMHIGGRGPGDALRADVEAVLAAVAERRGGDPAAAAPTPVENTLDTGRIDELLGHSGELTAGVYRITIGRPDVDLRSEGVPVTSDMGFNTWAAWQGTPERAAVAGDFAMLRAEVGPVVEALVSHGIEVVALHTHMVHEEPRIFFLHYWGTGSSEELARGLRAALDRTGGGNGP